jgi:hypothetical protein
MFGGLVSQLKVPAAMVFSSSALVAAAAPICARAHTINWFIRAHAVFGVPPYFGDCNRLCEFVDTLFHSSDLIEVVYAGEIFRQLDYRFDRRH